MPPLDPNDVAGARNPDESAAPRHKKESKLAKQLREFRDERAATIEFQRELAEHQRKAAAAPASTAQVQRVIEQALEKQRKSRRGNTQGCGCLLMIVGLFCAFLFPPIGGLFLLIGFIVLIVGLLV